MNFWESKSEPTTINHTKRKFGIHYLCLQIVEVQTAHSNKIILKEEITTNNAVWREFCPHLYGIVHYTHIIWETKKIVQI